MADRIRTSGLVPPDSGTAMWQVPAIAKDFALNAPTIFVAVDGIGYDVAHRVWSEAPHLTPLSSTFPSTSTSAWLSAVTGLRPEEHGVLGVVYFDPGLDRMV